MIHTIMNTIMHSVICTLLFNHLSSLLNTFYFLLRLFRHVPKSLKSTFLKKWVNDKYVNLSGTYLLSTDLHMGPHTC